MKATQGSELAIGWRSPCASCSNQKIGRMGSACPNSRTAQEQHVEPKPTWHDDEQSITKNIVVSLHFCRGQRAKTNKNRGSALFGATFSEQRAVTLLWTSEMQRKRSIWRRRTFFPTPRQANSPLFLCQKFSSSQRGHRNPTASFQKTLDTLGWDLGAPAPELAFL